MPDDILAGDNADDETLEGQDAPESTSEEGDPVVEDEHVETEPSTEDNPDDDNDAEPLSTTDSSGTGEDGGDSPDDDVESLKARLAEYEKKAQSYDALLPEFTRRSQMVAEIKKTFGEDANLSEIQRQLEEAKRMREQQEAQSLPPHDPRSVHHERWNQSVQRVTQFEQMMRTAQTDEERKAIGDMFARQGLSQDEVIAVHNWRQQQSDPSNIQRTVQEQVRAELEQHQAQERALHQARSFLEDPNVKPIAEKWGLEILGLINQGYSLQDAVDRYKAIEKEIASRSAEADRKAASAKAQQQAGKRKAVAQRDTANAPPSNLLEEARKLCEREGVPPKGPNLARAIREVSEQFPHLQ